VLSLGEDDLVLGKNMFLFLILLIQRYEDGEWMDVEAEVEMLWVETEETLILEEEFEMIPTLSGPSAAESESESATLDLMTDERDSADGMHIWADDVLVTDEYVITVSE